MSLMLLALTTINERAAAQTVPPDLLTDAIRSAAARYNLGKSFQALAGFGATPGVSAAEFYVTGDRAGESLDISTYKVPVSHEFKPIFGSVRPYAELTLGLLLSDVKTSLALPPNAPTNVDSDMTVFTGLTGVGLSIPVSTHTIVRPVFILGYAHLHAGGEARGPLGAALMVAGRGLLFGAGVNNLLIGGALELKHQRTIGGDINLQAGMRYNHLNAAVLSASDPLLEKSNNFGILTSHLEVDGPLDATLLGRDLRWLGFIRNAYLPGSQAQGLGFRYFFELGTGLQIVDSTIVSGVEGISLRASAILGDRVVGWSAGISVEF